MPPHNTVTLDAHAAANLRYIRASMLAASTVPVPGTAAVTMGVLGLAAAGIAARVAPGAPWFLLWFGAAFLAAGAASLIMTRQYVARDLPLLAAPVRKLLLCLLPSLFAGAVLTTVDLASGDLHAIPGSWLLLYGCGLLAASVPTAACVGWLGALFAILGAVALILPDGEQNLLLGLGFGALHLFFGLYVGASSHGRAR